MVLFEVLFDGAEIHRLLDYVKIIVDLQLHWVHWLIEDPGLGVLGQCVHHPVGHFFPVVVDWHRLVDWGHVDVLRLCFILEVLCYFWVVSGHRVELLLRDRSILGSVEHLEDVFLRL